MNKNKAIKIMIAFVQFRLEILVLYKPEIAIQITLLSYSFVE